MKRLAIVAVESDLIGRTVTPNTGHGLFDPKNPRPWPWGDETEAEIVAVFVGDLDEGGALKAMIRSPSGRTSIVYPNHFFLSGGAP